MQAAVAAGHPATTAAGIEILEERGSAADATVAAVLASCVAETVMTGLLGGGHAIYFDAATGTARNLDCFVAVPGLGAEPREPELIELEALAEDPSSVYGGSIAEALLALCADRGGLVTKADLDAYGAQWSEPAEVAYLATQLLTRRGLSGMPETIPHLPVLRGLDESQRVLALVDVLEARAAGASSLGSECRA